MSIRRILPCITLLFMAVTILSFHNHIMGAKPDFAFPQKVEKEARAELKKALRSRDDRAAAEALVALSLARTLVSEDSIAPVLEEIASVRTQMQTAAGRSVLLALEARIYREVYQADSWTYDRRESSLTAGDNYKLWSRGQFLDKISALSRESLADKDALTAVSVLDWHGVVSLPSADVKFYPTLYDFLAVQALENLASFSQGSGLNVLPAKLLQDPADSRLYPSATCAPLAQMLEIYRSLIELHADNPVARIPQEIASREFVYNHLFDRNPYPAVYGQSDSTNPLELELLRLYQAEQGGEYAGLYLNAAAPYVRAGEDAQTIYPLLRQYAADYPDGFLKGNIVNYIQSLGLPSATVTAPRQVLPNIPFEVRVVAENANRVKVELFDITSRFGGDSESDYANIKLTGHATTETEVEFADSVPFTSMRTAQLTLPEYGIYAVRLTVDGQTEKPGYRIIRCSALSVATSGFASRQHAWVVNPLSGEPCADVNILFKPWSRRSGASTLPGTTGNDGAIEIKLTESGYLSPQRGADLYAPGIYAGKFNGYNGSREQRRAEVFTSLALYHPGDEMEFAVVAYCENDRGRKLLDNVQLKAVLLDANRQETDTIMIDTDNWGRARGRFTLPSQGLTGRFSVEIYAELSGGRNMEEIGSGYFNVSDYKLPTFELQTLAINPPADGKGASVRARAVTYSGFPVADAAVKSTLKVQTGRWWRKTESPVFYTAEATTDASGEFAIEIPAEIIAASPAPGGLYICNIDVTSGAGETIGMEATFNMGKPLTIVASIPSVINAFEPVSAKIEVTDAAGKSVDIPLVYKVYTAITSEDSDYDDYNEDVEDVSDSADEMPLRQGDVAPGAVGRLLASLPTGSYRITFEPKDTALAEVSEPQMFVVYRPDDKVCPVDRPLWVPVSTLYVKSGEKASITVGSNSDDGWMRVICGPTPSDVADSRWVRLRKGMQQVEVDFPQGTAGAEVVLSVVKNFQTCAKKVRLLPADSVKSVKMTIETFRDRVVPGSTEQEQVKLRVEALGDTPAQSALMLDMASKAIDVLAPNPISMSQFRFDPNPVSTSGWQFYNQTMSLSDNFSRRPIWTLTEPDFELYDLRFTGGGVRYYSVRSYATAANMKMAAPIMEDAAESMDMEAAAPAGAVEETAGEGAADAGASGNTPEKGKTAYRPSEIPLAFFRPNLTTEADGSLEFSYTVPDANTTWVLRALSYNRNLLSANTQTEIIASKPVMVAGNAPRFLRTSDTTVLRASVMNNTTDSAARTFEVVSEVLSASSGEVLASSSDTITLEGMKSGVVTVGIKVPVGATGLVYRVRASADGFSDGEQSLIPVLPSEQDVVESQIFYIAPDSTHYSMELPALGADDRAYLNFTENPAWQVVSALPGLRDRKINSSLEAAASLFSACVARGLMRDSPDVAMVLRRWLSNPSDSALVSALEKNSQLKTILLESTPWVSAALTDTERMQRLALIFDNRQTEAVINEALDLLGRTYSNGGWTWTEKYPVVSQWCTEVILDELGQLREMGWLPSDRRLNTWIKEGCEYLDREAVKDYARSPQADYWLYVTIRDRFPEVKPSTAARRVIEAQVQKSLARWKESDVSLKGVYALILENHGYHATACQVLESLRQYATYTPAKGMWWQQLDRNYALWSFDRVGVTSILLDAFHKVEPGCADVERIRQWLILNKTNNDWGSAVMTTQTIASILTSGRSLSLGNRSTAIHIGDTLIEPANPEYATGDFTRPVSSLMSAPTTLTIDRRADYPSVGAVMTLRRLPMDEVKAVGCEEISVGKQLTVFNGSAWEETDSFKVGDRVRVELTLKVESDLSYVVISDARAAGLEPVEQLPAPICAEGLYFYREMRDDATNIFIDFLPRGTYNLTYELFASREGDFANGVAQVQSQYNPIVSAHSAGSVIEITMSDGSK